LYESFLTFLENSLVYEQNLDTWKFGKGALSGEERPFGGLRTEEDFKT